MDPSADRIAKSWKFELQFVRMLTLLMTTWSQRNAEQHIQLSHSKVLFEC